MHDWELSPVTAGFIGSSALFGMMVGALTLGSSSDRFGRRRIILLCLVVFGIAAFGNAFCTNTTEFAAVPLPDRHRPRRDGSEYCRIGDRDVTAQQAQHHGDHHAELFLGGWRYRRSRREGNHA